MRAAIVVATCLSVAIVSGAAIAAPHDDAAAEALFIEGRKLMEQGRFEEACPKLLASQKASPGVGTLLNLGECYEKAGKTATAWATFRDAIEAAHSAGRADREKIARARADAIEPKLARVKISTNGAPPKTVVKRDGVVLDAAVIGVALPVDPGRHEVEVTAEGYQPFKTQVDALPGKTVVVDVPELTRASGAAGGPAAGGAASGANGSGSGAGSGSGSGSGSGAGSGTEPPADAEKGSGTLRLAGWVGVGLGAAAIGVGGFFALNAKSKWSDAQSHCRGTICDREGGALASDAKSAGNLATAFVIGGMAIVAGGIALVVIAPPSSTPAPATPQTGAALRLVPSWGGASLVAETALP